MDSNQGRLAPLPFLLHGWRDLFLGHMLRWDFNRGGDIRENLDDRPGQQRDFIIGSGNRTIDHSELIAGLLETKQPANKSPIISNVLVLKKFVCIAST